MSDNSQGLYLSRAVLNLVDLSWPARFVLAELIALHRTYTTVSSRDAHFAERLHLSVRTVRGAIAELEAQGYIIRLHEPAAEYKRTLSLTLLGKELRDE